MIDPINRTQTFFRMAALSATLSKSVRNRFGAAAFVRNWCPFGWAAAVVLLTVSISPALGADSTELIVNGSFEDNLPGSVPPYGFFPNITGDAVYGWEITSGSMDLVGHYWQASDGVFSLDLIGGDPGAIEQSFATVPTVEYEVVFDMATNPVVTGPGLQALRVSAAGSSAEFSIDPTGRTQENMGWVEVSWSFVATSTMTTLSFAPTSPPRANGPALDHVRVTAVPEPGGLILSCFGIMGVVALRRRFFT